jgi:hypothetical protein
MAAISEPLRFPRGVRLAIGEEIRKCTTEILERIANADVRTGFVLTAVEYEECSTYIEANVHADRIWETFTALADVLIPQIAAPIVGENDDEPSIGPYTKTAAAMAALLPHIDSLHKLEKLQFIDEFPNIAEHKAGAVA